MTQMAWLSDIGGDFTAPGAAAAVSAGGLVAAQTSASGFSLNVATGQDASGNIQTAGDLADAHWTVTGADSYKNSPIAYTVAPGNADWFGGWFANGPTSSWIAANPDSSANGAMTLTLTFDLTGYNPADASLMGGQFAMDDLGTVYLNGHDLGSTGYPGWESFHALSNGAGDFVAGVNTLVIQGGGSDSVYEAARLEGTIVDTVTTNPPGPVHWANPISGDFATAADWTGGFVPGAANDAILDPAGITLYTVTSSTNETVNSIQTAANATLAITGAYDTFTATNGTGGGANAGTISVGGGATLTVGGVIDNSGAIVVTAQTGLPLNEILFTASGVTLTGGGRVTLAAAIGGGPLTNVDNIISGGVGLFTTVLDNEQAGVIDATSQSEVSAVSMINDGLVENTGKDRLIINFSTLDQSGGGVIFAADGASINIGHQGSTLIGGTLKTAGTGVIHSGDVTFDGTTSTVNNQGLVLVSDFAYLGLEGAINNTGTISLYGGVVSGVYARPRLIIDQAGATLTGGGSVVLNGNGLNIVTGVSSAATLTNVDDTISGAGLLGLGSMSLVNEAAGVIDANDSVGLVLDTGPDTVINAGLIEATGAGGLTIRNTTVDGSGGGVILAGAGSHVGLQGATLIGGTLKSAGSGLFVTFGAANALDGTVSTVNNQAILVVADNSGLTLRGTLNNTGKIALASRSAGAALTVGAAGATLSGGGRLLLNNSALNRIVGANSAATLTNVDNTLNGAGQIGAGSLTLVNQAKGVIVGSLATALVIDTGANTIANAGIILSRGAGGVTIQSAVTNSGVLEAAGGVLTVNGAVSGSGAGVIAGGTLDFTSSFSQKVVFRGPTGVLELAQSQSYAGTVFGFSKTGGTSLDLADIGFVSATEATFSGLASGGVLTVTDGTHTAHIALRGDYTASTFTASSDGHGGTVVVDPAAPAAAHRFVAAAAGLGAGGGGGAMALGHDAWRAPPAMLARPAVMVA